MNEKPFISIKEAASLLGVSVSMMYRESAKPNFPATRRTQRGKLFIDQEKLVKWWAR